MVKVLVNLNNVVVLKGNIEVIEEGFKSDGVIYGNNLELTLIETNLLDKDIIPQKHKLIGDVISDNHSLDNYINAEKQKVRDEYETVS